MAFIPMRDTEVDLPTKALETMKRGVMRGAKYIVKMNDNQCLNPAELSKLIKENNEPEFGYFGKTERTTKTRPNQNAAEANGVKFMSGQVYALSFALARMITFQDMNYAALYPMYGSVAEDADMGRWVDHAQTAHNITVKYATGPILFDGF